MDLALTIIIRSRSVDRPYVSWFGIWSQGIIVRQRCQTLVFRSKAAATNRGLEKVCYTLTALIQFARWALVIDRHSFRTEGWVHLARDRWTDMQAV